jgi:hypothetical protein
MTHNAQRFYEAAYEAPISETSYMPLNLKEIPAHLVHGIYGKKKNELPARMRYLASDAARSFIRHLSPCVVVSDMYRSAEASLRARKNRKGAQRPGYSGHNYGKSIDLDIGKSIKGIGLKNKKQLDEFMELSGWYCHRRDHKRDFESWHYNYFGLVVSAWVHPKDKKTSYGLERMIVDEYGHWWKRATVEDAQIRLTRLGMYDGDIDNKRGPLTSEAVRIFQRAWLLPVDKKLNQRTQRTLAFVTADKRIP